MGKKIGLAGGFSARYGTVTRRQYVEIVTGLRGKHECPRCMFRTVKRWSVGVWHCRKCGYKFAGGAYTPRTKLGEIAARATRGLMSPSTLSTELDSLRAGAKVAITVTPQIKKTRTRRKKVVTPEAEKIAETILRSVIPETQQTPGYRSSTRLEARGRVLTMHIQAQDLVALRAASNSFLRLVSASLRAIEVVAPFYRTRRIQRSSGA